MLHRFFHGICLWLKNYPGPGINIWYIPQYLNAAVAQLSRVSNFFAPTRMWPLDFVDFLDELYRNHKASTFFRDPNFLQVLLRKKIGCKESSKNGAFKELGYFYPRKLWKIFSHFGHVLILFQLGGNWQIHQGLARFQTSSQTLGRGSEKKTPLFGREVGENGDYFCRLMIFF